MSKNKITVAIPTYKNHDQIQEAIDSVVMQEYPLKEILICDDEENGRGSFVMGKDTTIIRYLTTDRNLGIGKNLEKLMDECTTKYIIYLCADDVFTHPKVLNDVVQIFDSKPEIGIVGRYYYYFMDGHKGAIGVCRDKNILTSSCCPSGMAFRTRDDIVGVNKIFVEMPYIVAQYLKLYRWTMLEYDTVAARYCPGVNTGTKTSYYTESPTQNWIDLLGQNYQDFPIFITLKNRAPKLLWREIWLHIKNDPRVLLCGGFWLNATLAVLIPGFLLKRMTLFYRHRIARGSAKIIERLVDNQ